MQVGSESGSEGGRGSGSEVETEDGGSQHVTLVARLKKMAARLRSLGVKLAVVPLSQKQWPRRPG